jgi:hypothetical protein
MAKKDLDEIRDCTNKSWVLGDERFRVKKWRQRRESQACVWGGEMTGSQRNTERVKINDSDPFDCDCCFYDDVLIMSVIGVF